MRRTRHRLQLCDGLGHFSACGWCWVAAFLIFAFPNGNSCSPAARQLRGVSPRSRSLQRFSLSSTQPVVDDHCFRRLARVGDGANSLSSQVSASRLRLGPSRPRAHSATALEFTVGDICLHSVSPRSRHQPHGRDFTSSALHRRRSYLTKVDPSASQARRRDSLVFARKQRGLLGR